MTTTKRVQQQICLNIYRHALVLQFRGIPCTDCWKNIAYMPTGLSFVLHSRQLTASNVFLAVLQHMENVQPIYLHSISQHSYSLGKILFFHTVICKPHIVSFTKRDMYSSFEQLCTCLNLLGTVLHVH